MMDVAALQREPAAVPTVNEDQARALVPALERRFREAERASRHEKAGKWLTAEDVRQAVDSLERTPPEPKVIIIGRDEARRYPAYVAAGPLLQAAHPGFHGVILVDGRALECWEPEQIRVGNFSGKTTSALRTLSEGVRRRVREVRRGRTFGIVPAPVTTQLALLGL